MTARFGPRIDSWGHDDDLILVETVLRHIREGSTQLKAFEEARLKLGRTAAACSFRWNNTLRRQYATAIQMANMQREALKERQKEEERQRKEEERRRKEQEKELQEQTNEDVQNFEDNGLNEEKPTEEETPHRLTLKQAKTIVNELENDVKWIAWVIEKGVQAEDNVYLETPKDVYDVLSVMLSKKRSELSKIMDAIEKVESELPLVELRDDENEDS